MIERPTEFEPPASIISFVTTIHIIPNLILLENLFGDLALGPLFNCLMTGGSSWMPEAVGRAFNSCRYAGSARRDHFDDDDDNLILPRMSNLMHTLRHNTERGCRLRAFASLPNN